MNKIFIISLITLIFILRLAALDKIPPHLRNDEADLGYNAFSILKTARDEHGQFLPILFQSFGDWKPGLYVYLIVPFIATFGLTEFAVRLPAAISGIFGVYLLYLLTKYLFRDKKIALFAAFSLAFSPWHIAFSRGAWEAIVTVTLILAGLIFFIKSLQQNHKFLIVAAGFFGASLLTSHGAKPAILLLILSVLLVYWKKVLKIPRKTIILSCLVLLILSLPIIVGFMNGKNTRISSLLFTNKYQILNLNIAGDFLSNWANHYSLPILFIKGDGNPQHTAADFGAFIPLDIIFLFLGFRCLIQFKSIDKETRSLIFILLILAPISSALTAEGVNFERYLFFFIPLNILIGLGLSNCKKNLIWTILLLTYAISFLLFLDAYFIHTPSKNGAWQFGYKEIVKYISPIQNNFQNIYIPQGPDQPYIFFLFYQSYPPEKYHAKSASILIPNGSGMGMNYVSQLDNIHFVDLNKLKLPEDESFLIALPANNIYKFENQLRTIHEIKDQLGFTLYTIKENYIENE